MDPGFEQRTADWYGTRAGIRAAGLLRAALRPMVRTGTTARLLAIGAGPLLDLDPATLAHVALVAAGARSWPARGPGCAIAADPAHLPFHEALFDQAVVVHALEASESPRALLRELWRVLAPAGELLLVVPNRASLWALTEATPFGEGRTYGRRSLRRTLDDAMFEIVERRTVLAAPPIAALRWSEGLLGRCAPGVGGVHLVRAAKTDGLAPIGRAGAVALVPARAG